MNKNKINAVIDIFMFLAFIVCIYSAIVLRIILSIARSVSCTPAGDFSIVLHMGMARIKWLDVHIWSGWIFSFLVIIHIAMHKKEIKNIPSHFRNH